MPNVRTPDATVGAASAAPAPVTLIVGPELFVSERAVGDVVQAAKTTDPEADVTEVTGSDLTRAALAEHTSPSLFAQRRELVLHVVPNVDETVGDALVGEAVGDDIHLVLIHPGGVKGKKLLEKLRKAGVREITAEKITRPDDQVAFVRTEVRRAGGRIDADAARRVVEAVGGDLRGLAAAASQLASDAPDGQIDADVVGLYFEGRAEVKGWAVADRAVEGKTPEAVEQLRWALDTGTDAVLIVGALATALRSLAKLADAPRGVRDADLARDIGVPPWKIRVLRGQLRGWTTEGLAQAITAVAAADLAVKGERNDNALALTEAIIRIGDFRGH